MHFSKIALKETEMASLLYKSAKGHFSRSSPHNLGNLYSMPCCRQYYPFPSTRREGP